MTHDLVLMLCLLLALWSAVVGGVFSAFSEFIMAALARCEAKAGIEAMQHINITVLRTQFVAGILLIGPLSLLLGVYGMVSMDGVTRYLLLAAPLIYLPCVLLMTVMGNVPMNNRLAAIGSDSPEAEAYWSTYLTEWTRRNHVRTAGSVMTAAIYLAAVVEAAHGAVH